MKYTYINQLPREPMHYFASNTRRWEVSKNPEKLIQNMKESELDFNLWLVKLDIKKRYVIKFAMPDLEDDLIEYLGTWIID